MHGQGEYLPAGGLGLWETIRVPKAAEGGPTAYGDGLKVDREATWLSGSDSCAYPCYLACRSQGVGVLVGVGVLEGIAVALGVAVGVGAPPVM